MAAAEKDPTGVAKQLFWLTMVGAVLYIGAVFLFVLDDSDNEENKPNTPSIMEAAQGTPGSNPAP